LLGFAAVAEPPLPAPPPIALEVVRDRTAEARATGGFLNLKRVDVIARYPKGEVSAPFAYDMCDRAAMDAVIVVAHYRAANGARQVLLRSCSRPPVALREPREEIDRHGRMWEVVAGLIEPGEDARSAGARELAEELGFTVPAQALAPLGPFTYPAPGIIGERHVFFHVEVDPKTRATPTEDGSALERAAEIIEVDLETALRAARAGELRDAKTELALRRLAEAVP
jgi:ADP-ribose pyrophosphatase